MQLVSLLLRLPSSKAALAVAFLVVADATTTSHGAAGLLVLSQFLVSSVRPHSLEDAVSNKGINKYHSQNTPRQFVSDGTTFMVRLLHLGVPLLTGDDTGLPLCGWKRTHLRFSCLASLVFTRCSMSEITTVRDKRGGFA